MYYMKKFIKENIEVLLFIVVYSFIELFAITYTSCGFYLTKPLYPIMLLFLFVNIILLFRNKFVRLFIIFIILLGQVILDTMFIFLYDSNGTIFEWAMLNQRTDAFGTVERYDLKYSFILVSLLIIFLSFITFIIKYVKNRKNKEIIECQCKLKNRYSLSLIVILIIYIVSVPIYDTHKNSESLYKNRLYTTTSNSYQAIGMISNSIYQIIRGKCVVNYKDVSDVKDFIYKDRILKSNYYGISKDNNLVLILLESGEWYPFDLYKDKANILYPNLFRLMNEGLIGSNYYQKEKTDVSEALSLLGNYPTGKYVNYDFVSNHYPYALPNLLKNNDQNIINKSFHANYGGFYNRFKLHKYWGFENLVAIKDMEKYGVYDNWKHKEGERNLDSITFEKMKEEMFLKDDRFFSFIISFTTHGYYEYRNNLKSYYKILEDNNILVNPKNKEEEYLKTYMAALMDFDKGIGVMLNYLEEINKLDNTTIVIYSDHNTYYNKLSYYAKNIDEKFNSELYHIPFIIYDKKLSNEYLKVTGNNKIEKFITTSDITPTILDIFGLDGWQNLYFGNSIFVPDVESIVFSRNYGIFVSDKLVGNSIKDLKYVDKDLSKEELEDFERRALIHLEKLKYIDKIYYTDYFKDNEYIY